MCYLSAFAASSCSSSNGTFPVSGSCDSYIECRNGVAEEKLCPDGLLYNEKSTGYPCGYPIDVDCQQGQGRIQPAQPTEECPHQFGYFPLGDSKNCGQFKNCADGRGYVFDCPDDLAWNKETYKCDWPDMVEDCDAAAFLGFKCPGPASSSAKSKSSLLGEQAAEYHFYPDPQSCQHYFICLEGRPRRIGCGEDRAFNQELNECDDIENVPNCSAGVKQKGSDIKNARLQASKAQTTSQRSGFVKPQKSAFASQQKTGFSNQQKSSYNRKF